MADRCAEKLVFNHAVEAMFLRALDGRLSAGTRGRLRGCGLDLDQPLRAAYPLTLWMDCLKIAAEDVFQEAPAELGLRWLGELMIDAYAQTAVGRALFGLARVVGPRHTLRRAKQSFRSANNYTEAALMERAPGEQLLWLNEVGAHPTFTAGLIASGLRHSGAREIAVEVEGYDGHECTYRVRWSS